MYITKYIIKGLEDILGSNAIYAIESYLVRYDLKLNDICYKPMDIRTALYKMFGDSAYRLEESMVKSIYKLLDLRSSMLYNIVHAIHIAMLYYKLSRSNIQDIDEIIDIIDVKLPLYCKSCDRRLDLSICSYNGLLAELCNECYEMQDTLYDTFNDTF